MAEAVGEPVDDEESAALDASLAGKKKKKKKPKVCHEQQFLAANILLNVPMMTF